MKPKCEHIISILAVLLPICSVAIMLFVEPELVEAIFGGFIVGCIPGSVLGTIALIINKGKSRFVSVFSIIPMCPLAIYLLLLIPY